MKSVFNEHSKKFGVSFYLNQQICPTCKYLDFSDDMKQVCIGTKYSRYNKHNKCPLSAYERLKTFDAIIDRHAQMTNYTRNIFMEARCLLLTELMLEKGKNNVSNNS